MNEGRLPDCARECIRDRGGNVVRHCVKARSLAVLGAPLLKIAGAILGLILGAASLSALSAQAEVKEIVVASRAPWLGGRVFGAAGAYEKLQGRVLYEVDPRAAVNAGIADVALAPRNARGMVEFSGDFVVLRPVDAAKARSSMILEILNRGNTQANDAFFRTSRTDPFRPEALDDVRLTDAMAFEQGFTMAWVGWQFDLPKGKLRLEVPTAPVSSTVMDAFLPTAAESGTHIDDLGTPGSYCAADAVQAAATMTVKTRFDAPGTLVPRNEWSFAKQVDGKAVADACSVLFPAGFMSGHLYEVKYQGTAPAVAGLGLAAIRDFVSYIKYGGVASALREHPETERRVLGYGYSQSARFLREYLYDGFNADEHGRKAFDGVFVASAGAGRGSFNHRYAMPGQAGNSVLSDLRPVDMFPFTDGDEVDPVTHDHGALLAKARAAKVVPKIFYTYGSSEYWARVGSLATTTVDGTRDLPLDADARLYFMAGTPHAHSAFPPVKVNRRTKLSYEDDLNFSSANWTFRALLMDLDAWTAKGEEPPASVYPKVALGQLVELKKVRFPASGEMKFPETMPEDWRMDYGKSFPATGVIENEPPRLGAPYTVLVPQVDADGNDVGGVVSPFLAVPLGTFTGWNYELPKLPSFDYLAGLVGGFEAFAATQEMRTAEADARPSMAERYKSREDYMAKAHAAVLGLVGQRLLRQEDVGDVEREMGDYWDGIAAMKPAVP